MGPHPPTALARPGIDSRYRVEPLPGGVLLLSERRWRWLDGELYRRLIVELDGRSTPAELVESLRDRAKPVEIFAALVRLEEMGVLESPDRVPPRPLVDGRRKPERPSARVEVMGVEGTESAAAELRAFLAAPDDSAGDNKPELTVVLADDYLGAELAEKAAALEAARRPWLPAKPRGEIVWVGPPLRPGEGPCFGCLTAALRENRPVEVFLATHCGAAGVPLDGSRESLAFAVAQIARRAVRCLGPGGGSRPAELETLDLVAGSVERHRVRGRPECPSCGGGSKDGAGRPPTSIRVELDGLRLDGGYRTVAPDETLRRLAPAISGLTGIVHSVRARRVDRAGGLHLFTARHALPVSYERWPVLRRRLGTVAAGKGLTRGQARASAVCEAVERYAGFFRGDEVAVRAAMSELDRRAIHPNDCMLVSDSQYRHRRSWNAEQGDINWVPEPFDEGRAIDWSAAWSITEGRSRLLPTAYGFFDYQDSRESPFCRADSNGCAAGNTIEEAILQGLLELVERDAVALWWYNRARRPSFRVDAPDEFRVRLEARLSELGRTAWLLDLTTDFEIPVAVALSRRSPPAPGDLLLGFGAHPDPGIAAGRAWSELCQSLPAASDLPRRTASRRFRVRDWESLGWLEPSGRGPRRVAAGERRVDLGGELGRCLERVAQRGLEVVVLDQTRGNTPLRVVKVVVPGLRPWWPRFAPGRLFDLPVELGWLEEPRREASLSGDHLFL